MQKGGTQGVLVLLFQAKLSSSIARRRTLDSAFGFLNEKIRLLNTSLVSVAPPNVVSHTNGPLDLRRYRTERLS